VIRRVREVLDAGGEVWFGDETSLREFPPLRAAWSRVGKQAEVIITAGGTLAGRWWGFSTCSQLSWCGRLGSEVGVRT
jgi:hypothetical protein